MHMVSPDLDLVDRELRAGRLSCALARADSVRGGGRGNGWSGICDQRERLRPRRSRCAGCAVTHVLMPVVCLLRRVDAVGGDRRCAAREGDRPGAPADRGAVGSAGDDGA